jgi:hypothetical protein
LPREFVSWLDQVEVFLQKISTLEVINVCEISAILEALSANLEGFEKNVSAEENHSSSRAIFAVLLRRLTEKVWQNFHKKTSAHRVEQMVESIAKFSQILIFNGSFLHVMEAILLQFYQIRGSIGTPVLEF